MIFFTGLPALFIVASPALLFVGMMFLAEAPAEWARWAMTVYTAIVAALLAWTTAMPVAMLSIAALAVAALMIGGPYGLVVATAALGLLALVGGINVESSAIHPFLLPGLAILAVVGAVRGFFI